MKYLFLFLAMLLAASFLAAQPEIEYKPGRTDSARWKATAVQANGSDVVYYEPYDTLPNVFAFGKSLFDSGGFIGGYAIPGPEPFIEAFDKAFYGENLSFSFDLDRVAISFGMLALGSDLILSDTTYNSEMIGDWSISGPACGMPNDTMQFVQNSFGGLGTKEPDDLLLSNAYTIAPGHIAVYSSEYGYYITIIKKETDVYKGANGCEWTKLD